MHSGRETVVLSKFQALFFISLAPYKNVWYIFIGLLEMAAGCILF